MEAHLANNIKKMFDFAKKGYYVNIMAFLTITKSTTIPKFKFHKDDIFKQCVLNTLETI